MKINNVFLILGLCLLSSTAFAQSGMLQYHESQMNQAVFGEATAKAKEVFENLRTIAYVLSGFGLAAFATSAIFGKISWSWLGMIVVGLFILAQGENIAAYITKDTDTTNTPSQVAGNNTNNTLGESSQIEDLEK